MAPSITKDICAQIASRKSRAVNDTVVSPVCLARGMYGPNFAGSGVVKIKSSSIGERGTCGSNMARPCNALLAVLSISALDSSVGKH